jgi:glycosyltransferase involved in cell wall biosynthesis
VSNLLTNKVALFIADFGPGGAERVFANLARSLSAAGLEVDLVVGNLSGAAYLDQIPREVRVLDLGVRRVRWCLPALMRYLRRERPATLISARDHSNLAALLASRLARTGTRVIVTIHQTFSERMRRTQSLRYRLITRTLAWVVPWADGIVAVSRGAADHYARYAGIPRERIQVIHNPVISPRMADLARQPVDHPWFAPGQPGVVLGVGRLTPQKDFPTLLAAFALLRKTHDVRLLILGQGEERGRLEVLAQKLGVDAEVAMPGVVANPYAYMSRAVVFALSSAWEALPTVLIEALACGCPVVATDCESGPREILEGGWLGSLVPVGDPAALAAALGRVLDGAERHACDPAALKPFTEDESSRQYLELVAPDLEAVRKAKLGHLSGG